MSRAPVQTTLYALDRTGSLTAAPSEADGPDRSKDEKSPDDVEANTPAQSETDIAQDDGVTRIEALYLVFGKGLGLYALWASIGLIAYVYSLSRSTTAWYVPFATSAFGQHTIVGTIGVINGVLNGVTQPFVAKIADMWSRPHTLTLAVALYTIGYAMCAGAKNVHTVVAGQVIYTVGNSGITFMNSLIIADITSLQWRAFVAGCVNLPYVVNAFVGGFIVEAINGYSQDGWRWGFGMFCIILPLAISPALIVLLIGDHRAKKLGALSLASSSYARRQQLAGQATEKANRTLWQSVRYYWTRLNAFGFLLMGFAFVLLLAPMTLNTTADGGFTNPSLIAMIVVGGCCFIGWAVWDGFFATYPIMPRRVFNRTFVACVCIDFCYFASSYFVDGYFSSWTWVVTDWSPRDHTFSMNTVQVAMCGLAIFVGLIQRFTHRYKFLQIGGCCIRIIGMGLVYYSTKNPSDAVLVCSQVLVGIGGAVIITASYVAVQASVPHQDMAIAVAVLNLWSTLGSSVTLAISANVWNQTVPANLEKYVGDIYNATERATIFNSHEIARLTEPREAIRQAYLESTEKLYMAAIIVSCGSLIAAIFASNFYLGQSHNAVETHKIIKFRNKQETAPEVVAARAREAEEKVKADLERRT